MTTRLERAALLRSMGRVLTTFLAVAALAATMNWISADLVAPIFGYLGYTYVPAVREVLLLAVVMTAATALTLPRAVVRPSHVVLWTIFVVCVSPSMLMSSSTGYLPTETALTLTAAIGCAFSLVALGTPRGADISADASGVADTTGSADVIRFGGRAIPRGPVTWVFCCVYSLLTYGVMAATVGLQVRFLALDDIYDVRAGYSADVGSGGLLGYLLTGQAYVINPLVLARGIFRRRPSLIVLALVGQFLLYSSTGFKAVLFSFVAVLGMAILFRGRTPRSSLWFLGAPLGIMLVSAVADELQGSITWTSVFTRRFMLTPGLLSSVYVQYFSENPVAQYGYSFLKTWVDYPYDLPPPKRIADFLVPGSVGYANANLFADGFANFGWAGIFVAAAALFIWLRFLDRASRGLPLRVAAMAVVMPSIMLSNTSVFTAMLSHGLLMGVLVLAIAPRSGWQRAAEAPARADGGRERADGHRARVIAVAGRRQRAARRSTPKRQYSTGIRPSTVALRDRTASTGGSGLAVSRCRTARPRRGAH
jgi:hypothetical protein